MKKYLLLAALVITALSCKKENEAEEKIAGVKVQPVKIERFDKAFFESKPEDLPGLKQRFADFFPAETPDNVWLARMQEPFLKQLYAEAQKKFPDVKGLESDFQDLFKHIKYYYPEFKDPRVVTLINDDESTKAFYSKDMVIVPLSVYLGKDNKIYEGLPKYQLQGYEPTQILPDVVVSFSETKIGYPADRTLLSQMVYFGKQLYMKDLMLPDATDGAKMGYTKEQIKWSGANEAEIWRYFVDNKLLYDSDPKLAARFINPAPFSKFYLEIDNESPGRLGQWIGWQIVRAYAENHPKVKPQQLMQMDAKEIFENSKYKPKK